MHPTLALDDWTQWADALAYVPASPEALRRRGFDHMQRVAAICAERTGLPLLDALACTKRSLDQRDLGREGRLANRRASFECTLDPRHFERRARHFERNREIPQEIPRLRATRSARDDVGAPARTARDDEAHIRHFERRAEGPESRNLARDDERAAARIMLIDDVFTTGATLSAATEALLDAGVGEVRVVTLARVW